MTIDSKYGSFIYQFKELIQLSVLKTVDNINIKEKNPLWYNCLHNLNEGNSKELQSLSLCTVVFRMMKGEF